MKDKIIKFMQGRYGVDQLSRFTMGVAMVCIILAIFVRKGSLICAFLDTVGILGIVYTYFRILSRNIPKRYAENQRYLAFASKFRTGFAKRKNMMEQRMHYHIYMCPGCGQKIRIPRGKGTAEIEINCPKCHTKFVKKRIH